MGDQWSVKCDLPQSSARLSKPPTAASSTAIKAVVLFPLPSPSDPPTPPGVSVGRRDLQRWSEDEPEQSTQEWGEGGR